MESIVAFLKEHQRFVVVSHENPDGDSIGALLAITLGLRSLGKEVEAISADPIPLAYCRLPGVSEVRLAKITVRSYDAAILLECPGPERTGIEGLEKSPWIIVDHHRSCKPAGICNWIDADFGSVGQMVLRILEAMDVAITKEIATCLYAAVLTDTGSFQFGNTTARELRDAARLVQYGAKPDQVARMVYYANRPGKILLIGRLLSEMRMAAEGRIAWIVMDRETLESSGAMPEDTEGIINHLMSIHSVQVAAFFKQNGTSPHYRVSLRSKGDLDVSRIAQDFSGGGHRNAAGFTLHEDLDAALPKVIQALHSIFAEKRDPSELPSSWSI